MKEPLKEPLQKPFVVLPTYNEGENISKMVTTLFDLHIPNLNILVVDDSSPDGTQNLIEKLRLKFPRLFLLSRPHKEGLGKAYIAGFQEALKMGATAIVQMDADFSHDPQDVPKLLEGLKEFDLVIGSRYIRGGGTSNWSMPRLILSRGANLYARFVSGLPIYDTTAGFKAWRSRCLQTIELNAIQTNGYGFQIETNFRALKKGYKIKEIPILFSERRVGKSKMSKKIIWEALWLVWRLRSRQTYFLQFL